jgi:hypothetical protein
MLLGATIRPLRVSQRPRFVATNVTGLVIPDSWPAPFYFSQFRQLFIRGWAVTAQAMRKAVSSADATVVTLL